MHLRIIFMAKEKEKKNMSVAMLKGTVTVA
jgi:hypothetical protein